MFQSGGSSGSGMSGADEILMAFQLYLSQEIKWGNLAYITTQKVKKRFHKFGCPKQYNISDQLQYQQYYLIYTDLILQLIE